MNRRCLRFVVLSCSLWATCAWSADSNDRLVEHRLQIFRLAEGFQAETSLDSQVWQVDKAVLRKVKGAVTVFDDGTFRWGNDRLVLNDKGCFWNDQQLSVASAGELAFPEHRVKMIYSPHVEKKLGELVRLKIESKAPFQYMVRREDGLFELKETPLPVGMDIEVKAIQGPTGFFRISYLELELRSVDTRETIPGVTLPVGKPQMKEWEYIFEFNARKGRAYGILLRPEGTVGAMLIRLAISERPK